jgi:hypothetical protein
MDDRLDIPGDLRGWRVDREVEARREKPLRDRAAAAGMVESDGDVVDLAFVLATTGGRHEDPRGDEAD